MNQVLVNNISQPSEGFVLHSGKIVAVGATLAAGVRFFTGEHNSQESKYVCSPQSFVIAQDGLKVGLNGSVVLPFSTRALIGDVSDQAKIYLVQDSLTAQWSIHQNPDDEHSKDLTQAFEITDTEFEASSLSGFSSVISFMHHLCVALSTEGEDWPIGMEAPSGFEFGELRPWSAAELELAQALPMPSDLSPKSATWSSWSVPSEPPEPQDPTDEPEVPDTKPDPNVIVIDKRTLIVAAIIGVSLIALAGVLVVFSRR